MCEHEEFKLKDSACGIVASFPLCVELLFAPRRLASSFCFADNGLTRLIGLARSTRAWPGGYGGSDTEESLVCVD